MGCASYTTSYYSFKGGYGEMVYRDRSLANFPHNPAAAILVYGDDKIKNHEVWPYLGGMFQKAILKDVILFTAMIDDGSENSREIVLLSWRGEPPLDAKNVLIAEGLVSAKIDKTERGKFGLFLFNEDQTENYATVILDSSALNDPVTHQAKDIHVKFDYDTLLRIYRDGVANGDDHEFQGCKYYISTGK